MLQHALVRFLTPMIHAVVRFLKPMILDVVDDCDSCHSFVHSDIDSLNLFGLQG